MFFRFRTLLLCLLVAASAPTLVAGADAAPTRQAAASIAQQSSVAEDSADESRVFQRWFTVYHDGGCTMVKEEEGRKDQTTCENGYKVGKSRGTRSVLLTKKKFRHAWR